MSKWNALRAMTWGMLVFFDRINRIYRICFGAMLRGISKVLITNYGTTYRPY